MLKHYTLVVVKYTSHIPQQFQPQDFYKGFLMHGLINGKSKFKKKNALN